MTTDPTHTERRSDSRTRRSDAIFWRRRRADPFQMGWLLEVSHDGFAFAWRGTDLPTENSVIDLQLDHRSLAQRPDRARVCRVQRVHNDLVVIAGQMLHPFPAESAAALAARQTELKAPSQPVRLIADEAESFESRWVVEWATAA